ncbi:hypothetical protein INS49_012569 [Diaporthe citri]|uniref:uncharacterized protein n=1 Tax=Diaporthe citri TaxID=83186 RepID=UPI001C7E9BC4|nr:uncharacterized protein INS49_012569 [Diaporthe citri]KAG6359049.1 hypothetical protein INS49_012569 [Diaporthe citri]
MDQIRHVAACPEATKGEIKCLTCRKFHDFKRWHAVCNTLKSPVELLRRLSNRKRGSNTSVGEPVATKRGKIAVGDDFPTLSRQESHGVESMWWPEMEEPSSFPVHEIASTSNPALELDAEANNNVPLALGLRDSQAARPLPTPPSTRNPSWSEDSQNLVAYGDAKVAHVPEHPPPYVVSPQTTVDDYERHRNPSDSLRLGIPPVQFIHESTFMESPEDLEIPEADQPPWAGHAVFHEAEDPQANFGLVPTALDATVSAQYNDSPQKSASIFSSSLAASRIPNPHRQEQNSWPMQLHRSNDIPRSSLDRQQRQIFDGAPGLPEQDGPAAIAGKQHTRAEPSIARQASFDAGAQDSITVSSIEDRGLQTTSCAPGDSHQAPARRGTDEQQPRIARLQQNNRHSHQYEECGRCGQRFRGQPKNRRQHLKRHVESKHGDVRFRCGHRACARSYNRADNLRDHEAKAHGFVLQRAGAAGAGGGGPEVAELAAGDVELHHGSGQYRAVSRVAAAVTETEGSAPDTGHQASSAVETHFGVFGYSIPAEEGQGWRPAGDGDTQDPGARRAASLTEDEWGWEALFAGVTGGQNEGDEAGVPDVGHGEAEEDGFCIGPGLAPRPLDLPCTSWRAS